VWYNNNKEVMEVLHMVYGWIWLAVIVLAIVAEVFTEQLISIWFVPGAIISLVLDIFDVKFYIQLIVVLVLAAIGIVFAKTILKGLMPGEIARTNIDAIIGERCVVTEKIDNYAGCGQVKIKGQIWSARGIDENDVFESGDVLQVVAIEGVKVICKKI
jgi:membrane protein implicated in regulation of membrane protease activity